MTKNLVNEVVFFALWYLNLYIFSLIFLSKIPDFEENFPFPRGLADLAMLSYYFLNYKRKIWKNHDNKQNIFPQVTEVYQFIQALPGCGEYAEEFRSQEIDGQALLLLKEDHLMTAMNIKLGPALKICAKINSLRTDLATPTWNILYDWKQTKKNIKN